MPDDMMSDSMNVTMYDSEETTTDMDDITTESNGTNGDTGQSVGGLDDGEIAGVVVGVVAFVVLLALLVTIVIILR